MFRSLPIAYLRAVVFRPLPAVLLLLTMLGLGRPVAAQTATALTLTASPAVSTYGAVVTLTATVNSSMASGTVTFYANSGKLGTGTISSGVATLTATGLPVGSDSVTAVYGGDSGYAASTSNTATVQVGAATTAVGSTSATQQTVLNFSSTVTLNSTLATAIQVLTQGASGFDFTYVSGGTCVAGATYTSGQSCTVDFTFSPTAPGVRSGAVLLYDNSATPVLLATGYINGTGTGPLAAVYPGVVSNVVSGLTDAFGIAVDATDNLYIMNYTSGQLYKETYNGGTYTGAVLASFGGNSAYQVAVDGSGNLYATASSGLYKLTFNPATGGYAQTTISTTFASFAGVTVDSSGNVFVAYNTSVYKETPNGSGGYTESIVISGLSFTYNLTVDGAGDLFVNDRTAGALYKFAAGTYTRSTVASGFTNNNGVAVDASGIVYVVDDGLTSGVLRYVPSGASYTALPAIDAGTIPRTNGIAIDGRGNLFISSDATAPIGAFKIDVDTVTPRTLSYPATAAGSTSAGQSVTIFDVGNTPLTFSGFAPSTANFVDDAGTTTCSTGTALVSAGSCTVGFAFSPQTAGSLSASGTVTDNSLNVAGSTQTVALTGTGTQGTKTITFAPLSSPVAAGTTATLSAYASDNDPVSFSITSGTATIGSTTSSTSGGVTTYTATITYTTAGSVTVAADSPATANAATAPTVSQTVTVNPPPTSFVAPTEPVGTSSGTIAAVLTFTTAGTPATLTVSTGASTTLDFQQVAGGTCSTSVSYTVGQTCTVLYSFKPVAPGQRIGGVVALDSSGAVLAKSFLSGTGNGALFEFSAASASLYVSATTLHATSLLDASLDNGGNIYVQTYSSGSQYYTNVRRIPLTGGSGGGAILASSEGTALAVVVDGADDVFFSNSSGLHVYPAGSGTAVGVNSDQATHLAVDGAGNLYYSTSANLYRLAPGATTGTLLGALPATCTGLTYDPSGLLYLSASNNSIYSYSLTGGNFTQVVNSGLSGPVSIAEDGGGNLYVANQGTSSILRITPGATPIITTLLAATSPSFVRLDNLGALYIGSSGNLYKVSHVASPTLAFGSVNVGSTTAAQTATVENDGNIQLPISAVALTDTTNYALDTATNTCSVSTGIAAGGICTVGVVFAPKSAGSKPANVNLTFTTLNVAGTTQHVTLSGTGVVPQPTVTSVSPASGGNTGGTSVVITGTNLSGVTSVKFGTVSATSFTITSATSITAVSPAGTNGTTVDITVSNGTYSSATSSADQFSYLTAQTINFTQPSTPGFVNSTATLVATGGGSGNPVTFSIVSGPATLSGTNNAAITYTGTGTVVIAADQAGNATYSAAPEVTRTVTVVAQSVFIVNGVGSVTTANDGSGTPSSGVAGGGIGAAVDASGSFWSVYASGAGVSKFTDAGAIAANYTASNLTSGTAIAIDGNSVIWIAQGGTKNNIFALSNTGAVLSTTGFAQAGSLSTPASITINAAGSLWIANQGSNTITEVIGVAAPVTTPTVQQVINQNPGARP